GAGRAGTVVHVFRVSLAVGPHPQAADRVANDANKIFGIVRLAHEVGDRIDAARFLDAFTETGGVGCDDEHTVLDLEGESAGVAKDVFQGGFARNAPQMDRDGRVDVYARVGHGELIHDDVQAGAVAQLRENFAKRLIVELDVNRVVQLLFHVPGLHQFNLDRPVPLLGVHVLRLAGLLIIRWAGLRPAAQ